METEDPNFNLYTVELQSEDNPLALTLRLRLRSV